MTPNDEPFEIDEAAEVGEESAKAPLWRRLLFGAFVTFAVLFFVGVVLYRFGSPMPPSSEMRAAYAQLESAGLAPHPRERQFHIPIPGCKCHSDDPVKVIEHEDRRLSECMGCHGG